MMISVSGFITLLTLVQHIGAQVVDHQILQPVSDHDWPGMEQRHELMKRSPQHAVALQQNEHFVWTSPNSGFGAVYANMTLDTSSREDELVISMERFQGKLKSVSCSENMAMSFTSHETYQHAIEDWEWVNFNEQRTFVLIANHPDCGKDNSRQPWLVSNVHYEPELLTIRLDAVKKEWKDIAHTYSLDFGTFAPPTGDTMKRGLIHGLESAVDKAKDATVSTVGKVANTVDNVADKAKDTTVSTVGKVVDKVDDVADKVGSAVAKPAGKAVAAVGKTVGAAIDKIPEASVTKSFSVSLSHPFPPNMFAKQAVVKGFTFGVECDSCGSRGTLEIAVHVEQGVTGLQAFTLKASPRSVGADINLRMTASGQLPGHYGKQFNIFTAGLPGFTIPDGILTVGPNIQIDGGFNISDVGGSVVVTAGVSAGIPDSSSADVDFVAKKKLAIHGWVPKFTHKPISVESGQVSATVDLFVQINLAMSVECMKNGFQVDVGMKIPTVNVHATAIYEKAGGVCPGSPKQYGVKLDAVAGATILLQAYEEVMNKKKYFVNEPLYDNSHAYKFPPVCLPFGSAPKITRRLRGREVEVVV